MKNMDASRWGELMDAGTTLLMNLAATRGDIDYSSFNDQVCGGLFDLADVRERDQLGRLLGDISRKSVGEHGVMLSALVHHKGERLDVGTGFYGLAVDMGRLESRTDRIQRDIFLGGEIEKVYTRYGAR